MGFHSKLFCRLCILTYQIAKTIRRESIETQTGVQAADDNELFRGVELFYLSCCEQKQTMQC